MVHLEEGSLLALSFSLVFKAFLSKMDSLEVLGHTCLYVFPALTAFTK